MKPLKHSVKKEVKGPMGTFEIDLEDEKVGMRPAWSVNRVTGGEALGGGLTVMISHQLIGILPTARKALARARSAAGLPPFEYTGSRPAPRPAPDRQGLVAHSRRRHG